MSNPAKILIVDDEPFNIDTLEQELDDLGYATISAANGREALEQVEAENPDLILLDIMMPEMDGFEALTHLKADQNWRNIPVIVISAMSDLSSVVKGIKLGALDYLAKPFNDVLLGARIEAGLSKKRLQEQEKELLQLSMLREMNEFGALFIATIAALALSTFVGLAIATFTQLEPGRTPSVGWLFLLPMLAIVPFVMQSGQPWSTFGVTLTNWQRVTIEAIGISIPLLGIFYLAVWFYTTLTNHQFYFEVEPLPDFLYIFHSGLQEFIARGILQNSLHRFFQKKHPMRSIFWASVVFAMAHTAYGLVLFIATLLFGLIFGAVFMRQQNLIGVTIVHWLVGMFFFTLAII